MMKLTLENVGKDFENKRIFNKISFDLESGKSAAIIGPNGSGKTTLVRIVCGLIRPSRGKIVYSVNQKTIEIQDVYKHIGLVGPYLELYEELTAMENLLFFAKMKRVSHAREKILSLMDQLNLAGREDDNVRTYSSGMRQRLKYVFALLSNPEILVLDEPTSNLDSDGIDRVYEIMRIQKNKNILLIATNDQNDLKFGDFQIAVNA
jgi:heme exporter protein A